MQVSSWAIHPSQRLRTQLEALLQEAVPWLLRQQLPTGELVSYRKASDEDAFPYPFPLFSALASDALACLDPRSGRFLESLYDLIPGSRRGTFSATLATLQWRLRSYLVAEETPERIWRLHGRAGHSVPDLATTACAATMLGNNLPITTKHADVVRRMMTQHPQDVFGGILGLRALSMAGESIDLQTGGLLAWASHDADPLPALWAMAQMSRDGHLCADRDSLARMLSRVHAMGAGANGFGGRLRTAFGLTVLTHFGERGPTLHRHVDKLLHDPLPPWQWEHDALRHDMSSPAATLAIMVRALGQALAVMEGEDEPC